MTYDTRRGHRLRTRGLAALVAVAMSTVALTGCTLFGSSNSESTTSDGSDTLRITTPVIASLDPQTISNGVWLLSQGILEGLVTQDAAGTGVTPAVAESWSVSDDQTVYTFQLRDDARWSNDQPVTADDFMRTFQRLLSPRAGGSGGGTVGASSYQPSMGIVGANGFLAGTVTDWDDVGIKETTSGELEFTLDAPNPDFLLLLTHPSMLPLDIDAITEHPDDWQTPENFVSNGPFTVTSFVANSSITLTANPYYWDRSNVALKTIEVLELDAGAAAGTATVPYESGETDIVQISSADVLRFEGDPTLKDQVENVDTYSVSFLAKLRSKNPVLDDERVREALSLALDRTEISSTVPGARAATSLVTDRVSGYSSSLALEEDLTKAKQLLADAGYPNGEGLPVIHILTAGASPAADAAVDQWQTRLGIQAVKDQVDVGVYVQRRTEVQEADYIGFYEGSFAGLPTLHNFVASLWTPTDVENFSLPSPVWAEYLAIQADASLSPTDKSAKLTALRTANASAGATEMAALAAEADGQTDEEARTELYLQAAQLREDEHVYIPLLWNPVYFAIRPSVKGLEMRPYPDFFYFKTISLSE